MFQPGSRPNGEGVLRGVHAGGAALAPVVAGADVHPGPEVRGAGVPCGDTKPEAEDRQESNDHQHCLLV